MGLDGLCPNQLCHFGAQAATDTAQMNERGCVPIKFYLQNHSLPTKRKSKLSGLIVFLWNRKRSGNVWSWNIACKANCPKSGVVWAHVTWRASPLARTRQYKDGGKVAGIEDKDTMNWAPIWEAWKTSYGCSEFMGSPSSTWGKWRLIIHCSNA